jgi:Flp pilus assembly pilin Flp
MVNARRGLRLTYTACVTKISIGFDDIDRYPTRRTLRSKRVKESNPIMKTLLHNFVKDEQGQDLIEYTLLLAFVCLASAALFISAGGSVGGIWSVLLLRTPRPASLGRGVRQHAPYSNGAYAGTDTGHEHYAE